MSEGGVVARKKYDGLREKFIPVDELTLGEEMEISNLILYKGLSSLDAYKVASPQVPRSTIIKRFGK